MRNRSQNCCEKHFKKNTISGVQNDSKKPPWRTLEAPLDAQRVSFSAIFFLRRSSGHSVVAQVPFLIIYSSIFDALRWSKPWYLQYYGWHLVPNACRQPAFRNKSNVAFQSAIKHAVADWLAFCSERVHAASVSEQH